MCPATRNISPDRGGQRPVERQDRMARAPASRRARFRTAKPRATGFRPTAAPAARSAPAAVDAGERPSGASASDNSPCGSAKSGASNRRYASASSPNWAAVSSSDGCKSTAGLVVQGMRDRCRRANPAQSVGLQRQRPEIGRKNAQRVYGRTNVVGKARQRQLGGAHAAADLIAGLQRRAPPPRAGPARPPRPDHWVPSR